MSITLATKIFPRAGVHKFSKGVLYSIVILNIFKIIKWDEFQLIILNLIV